MKKFTVFGWSWRFTKTRFAAIVDSYQTKDSILIPEKVRIVWHLKDSEYEYYKGTIDRIIPNVYH